VSLSTIGYEQLIYHRTELNAWLE